MGRDIPSTSFALTNQLLPVRSPSISVCINVRKHSFEMIDVDEELSSSPSTTTGTDIGGSIDIFRKSLELEWIYKRCQLPCAKSSQALLEDSTNQVKQEATNRECVQIVMGNERAMLTEQQYLFIEEGKPQRQERIFMDKHSRVRGRARSSTDASNSRNYLLSEAAAAMNYLLGNSGRQINQKAISRGRSTSSAGTATAPNSAKYLTSIYPGRQQGINASTANIARWVKIQPQSAPLSMKQSDCVLSSEPQQNANSAASKSNGTGSDVSSKSRFEDTSEEQQSASISADPLEILDVQTHEEAWSSTPLADTGKTPSKRSFEGLQEFVDVIMSIKEASPPSSSYKSQTSRSQSQSRGHALMQKQSEDCFLMTAVTPPASVKSSIDKARQCNAAVVAKETTSLEEHAGLDATPLAPIRGAVSTKRSQPTIPSRDRDSNGMIDLTRAKLMLDYPIGYEGFNEVLTSPLEGRRRRRDTILGRKRSSTIVEDSHLGIKCDQPKAKMLHYWRLYPPLDYDIRKSRQSQENGGIQYGRCVFKVKVEEPSWATPKRRYASPIKVYDGRSGHCLMICQPRGKRPGWLSKGSNWVIEDQRTHVRTTICDSGDSDAYSLVTDDGQCWTPSGLDRDIRIRHTSALFSRNSPIAIQYTADEGRFGALHLNLVKPETLVNPCEVCLHQQHPRGAYQHTFNSKDEKGLDNERKSTPTFGKGATCRECCLLRAAHAVAIFEVVNALRDECSRGAGRSRRDERGRLHILPGDEWNPLG